MGYCLLFINYSIIYNIIAGLLILVLVFVMLRYLLLSSREKTYYPEQWVYYLRQGKHPKSHIKLEQQYPDKIRFFNLWFQSERLKREGVQGAFAELGVYKGETARILHAFDTNRRLHLFDTFEGFMEKDLKSETGEAATYSTKSFADTSPNSVLRYIGGNKNVLLHKGYFPDSAKVLKPEAYALVSIDTDLYQPVKEGLRYFYPLLSPGGVILIHDYTNKWEGLVKAVNEFAVGIPENIIEVPDQFGTVMIIKNKAIKH